ncbi:MAG: class I SAM-dependent methyltransferase [Dehalococcoidales bacterium]|nr:MAG: class I SAM-dependent methyltransferase [Dehalococcoidales bacterium]
MNSNRSNWESHWDEESQKSFWHEPTAEIVRLKESLDRQKIRDVLDLGCGIGRHAILFAESGFNVTAVDDSQNALDILREKASEKQAKITCIEGSYTEVIFTENSFDLIIANNVLYHGYREDFEKSVRLVYRYLRPGGFFYFTCPTHRDAKYGNGEEMGENTYKSLNSVHPGDIHYFADEGDIAYFLRDFAEYTIDREEHYWDNNGISQFSSSWHIMANK